MAETEDQRRRVRIGKVYQVRSGSWMLQVKGKEVLRRRWPLRVGVRENGVACVRSVSASPTAAGLETPSRYVLVLIVDVQSLDDPVHRRPAGGCDREREHEVWL